MGLLAWIPSLLLFGWFALGAWRESRRFGLGLILTAALAWTALQVLGFVTLLVITSAPVEIGPWVLLGVVGLLVLGVAVLGVFLVVNAVTMLRKEGRGLPMMLSGALGAAILGYVVAAVTVVALNLEAAVGWLVLIGLPAMYFAFLFVSFLIYSQAYQWGTRRFGGPVDAVIVLGSGLGGGERVTPLLAGRLDRGRAVFERSVEAGRSTVLIVSGGQGRDEKVPEATAMADYLIDRDFPSDCIVREDRSTDTEENLAYSADLMKRWGAQGDVAIATSNYHALRAAIIMRKAGIPGYTVGCRTARYYWPSATVREFAAIMLEHSRLNLIVGLLLWVPALIALGGAVGF